MPIDTAVFVMRQAGYNQLDVCSSHFVEIWMQRLHAKHIADNVASR